MESNKLISLNKLIRFILPASLIFLFTGVFWVLIAENDLIGYIISGLACIGLIYLCIYKLNEIKIFIKDVDWKKAGLKSYYIIIVTAVIILINVIANKRFVRKDFTSNKQYTLSGHSIDLLKRLEETEKSIKIIFFRSPGASLEPVEDLLKEYKSRCSVISIEFVNPDEEPGRTRQYAIQSIRSPYDQNQGVYATVVILSSGKKQTVEAVKLDFRPTGGQHEPQLDINKNLERELSTALLQMIKSEKKIYFVRGHGEVDLGSDQDDGWRVTKNIIDDENYIIDKLYLSSLEKIPDDCSVLVIGAPKKDYLKREYEILNNYLNKGGHILVLLEPLYRININKFLNKWGVKTSDKFIIDTTRYIFPQPTIPQIIEYKSHKITRKLENIMTFFPLVAPVEIIDKVPEGISVQGIAETSSDSWIEADTKSHEVGYDKGVDKKGPINIFAVITKSIDENNEARMAVIGDSDFANSKYVRSAGNMDLLLNTLNWLAGKEEMMGIRSKPVDRREMQLTLVSVKFVYYFCIFILPILVIIAGVVVWLKRR